MPTLLQISGELLAFIALLDEAADADGELSPEAAETLDRWFADLSQDRDLKLDNYAALIRELTLRAAARREEKERLERRVSADEHVVDSLKTRLRMFLEAQGIQKVETQRYRIALCQNGGAQPYALDVPAEQLPEQYRRSETTYRPRVEAIRDALVAGQDVPGCRLLPRGRHLRIS